MNRIKLTLFVFSLSDPKQIARSLLTPVSGTIFYALSHGSLGFALHGSFFNHLFIGWKYSTANQSLWNRFGHLKKALQVSKTGTGEFLIGTKEYSILSHWLIWGPWFTLQTIQWFFTKIRLRKNWVVWDQILARKALGGWCISDANSSRRSSGAAVSIVDLKNAKSHLLSCNFHILIIKDKRNPLGLRD